MLNEPKLGCTNPICVGVKFKPLPGMLPMTIGAAAVNGCRVKLPVPDTFPVQVILSPVRVTLLLIVGEPFRKIPGPFAVMFPES